MIPASLQVKTSHAGVLNRRGAYLGGRVVHRDNHYRNKQNSCTRVVPVEDVDVLYEQQTDATSADEADQGGKAHIHVPPVKREGDELRYELRYYRVPDHLEAVRARSRDRLDGA